MRSARHLIPLVLTLVLVATPASATAASAILFPVVGGASYSDDYGDPRPQGRHEGNDLMADKRTPVIAVADGVVELHYSPRAGYMLWLRDSKHEWVYIHLNNDRRGDDNRGGARAAYARGLRTGMRVRQGQEIAYVGDSGDAAGGASHLHFEERNRRGRSHDPYRRLRRAAIVLFSAVASDGAAHDVDPLLTGTLAWVADSDGGLQAAIRLESISVGDRTFATTRLVIVTVPDDLAEAVDAVPIGTAIDVATVPQRVTLARQLMRPGAWQVASITPR